MAFLIVIMELNIVYHENCIQTMNKMPDCFIDCVVTSPPYDGLRVYKGYSFDFETIAKELFRIIKEGGTLVWVVGDQTKNGSESGTSFRQALYFNEIGFNIHDTMIYHKEGLTMNHNRYEQEFEYMFVFTKGKIKTFNPIKIPCTWFGKDSDRTGQTYGLHNEVNKKLQSGKSRGNINEYKIKGNVWKYEVGYSKSTKDKLAFHHPAVFPEKLVKDHINSWSNEGDLIYDPFMGSGTTAIVAQKLNRKFIGSEISEEYIQLINKRLLNNKDLFN